MDYNAPPDAKTNKVTDNKTSVPKNIPPTDLFLLVYFNPNAPNTMATIAIGNSKIDAKPAIYWFIEFLVKVNYQQK